MKFKIENQQDYIAFLHGKILFEADRIGGGKVEAAEEYLRLSHSVSELVFGKVD
jgi:hypothetical protein